MLNGARRVIGGKLRKHQNTKGYDRCLESRRVEWEEDRNFENIWEKVK